jgi:hypothetical protein
MTFPGGTPHGNPVADGNARQTRIVTIPQGHSAKLPGVSILLFFMNIPR